MDMIYIFRNNNKGIFMGGKIKTTQHRIGGSSKKKKKIDERRHDPKFETGFP